jgi:sugar O-acyltransferase (sialic acid O-acetyltransferase NeuD family)
MWTIFGVSNLIFDIIDTIYSNRGEIKQIVINLPLEDNFAELLEYNIIEVKDYENSIGANIFGFTDPNKEAFLNALPPNTRFLNLYHERAYLPLSSELDSGNYLAAGAVIGTKVVMKNHNFVNRNASIGHHTQVGSFNHFGPGSIICGQCKIGSKNFFGAGSIVKDRIKIGDNITIGAGAVVTKDLLESGVYVGIPARLLQ